MRVPWILSAGLAVTLGCGEPSSQATAGDRDLPLEPVPSAPEEPTSPDGVAPSDPGAPPCHELTLYLNAEPFPGGEVAMEFSRIEVTREGLPVATTFTAAGVPLTLPRPGAYRMAVLPFPRESGPIQATFVPAGGARCWVEDAAATGRVCRRAETCGGAIQFGFDPASVRRDHCHVFVRLALARSMQLWAGGWWFVPQYLVQY